MKLIRSLFFIVLSGAVFTVHGQEEFIGPFASWANVVNRFQAKGDGIHDDTRALQLAIDNLSNPDDPTPSTSKSYMVVYLPKGIYKITKTLQLRGKIGVSIIGEDPSNTIIRWAGGNNDTMLWANGSAYFKISRITWDANQSKGIEGIGIHWKNRWKDASSQSYASLNNEISDNIFNNTAIGIGGGTSSEGTNSNDSEITIRRCTFNKCSEAGIKINGYNALDYWIWYCKFLECNIAINCHSGNYHVYNSYFKASVITDIWNTNSYYTSVRGCFSSRSRVFSWDNGMSCNPFKRIFQSNTILQPEEIPIGYYHLGSVTMMDNVIEKSRKPAIREHLNMRSWCPGDYTTLSIHNAYGYSNAINLSSPSKKIFSYDDSVGLRANRTESAFLKALPGTPSKVVRKIFEVPGNATAFVIQQIINEASKVKGTRPVIHFGFGKYQLDQTLIIPKESDMQLCGDGLLYASMLVKKNGKRGMSLIVVKGPSFITIQDLQIGDAGGARDGSTMVVFENMDQPSATFFIDQLYSLADTSLFLNGLNNLYLEKNNSFFSGGNYISGGNLQKSGKGSLQVNCFGGQFANLTVLNNAGFVAKDCWWEGPKGLAVDLKGEGNVTIDGAMVAPAGADSSTVIKIGNFNGKVSLLNMYVQGAMDITSNNDRLQILTWNVHFYHKMNPLSFVQQKSSYQGLFFGLTSQCFDQKNKTCTNLNPVTIAEKSVNITRRDEFTKRLTQSTRTSNPRTISKSKDGVSNVYITRVTIGVANRGFEFVNR